MNTLAIRSVDCDSWDLFFTTLAQAENAAGLHTNWLSEQFEKIGQSELAQRYQAVSEEEFHHAFLVNGLIEQVKELPEVTAQVYQGSKLKLDSATDTLAAVVERLAIIHLVFEPSALAILSYIHRRAHELFDSTRTGQISSVFEQILKEETKHIKESLPVIDQLSISLVHEDKSQIAASIKTHQAFVVSGIRRFFASDKNGIQNDLVSRIQFSFNQVSRGLKYAI